MVECYSLRSRNCLSEAVVEVNTEPIISSHPHDNIASSLNIVSLDLLTYCPDGKLKWIGNLSSLKRFVEDELGQVGKWLSPGGNTKLFSGEFLTLTWYPNKGTLLFQRNCGRRIREDLGSQKP